MACRNTCCKYLWTALLPAVLLFPYPALALDLTFSKGGVGITGGADYVLKGRTPDAKTYSARIWCLLASGDSLPSTTTVTTTLRLAADDTDVGTAAIQTFSPFDWTRSPSGYYIDLNSLSFAMPLPGSGTGNLHTAEYYLSAHVKGDKLPIESNVFNNRADSASFQYTVFSAHLIYDRTVYTINALTPANSSVCSGDTYLSAVTGNWTTSWWEDNFSLAGLCTASGANSDGYSTDLTVIRDISMAAMPPRIADPRWVIKGQPPEQLRLENVRIECEGSPPKTITLSTRLLNRDNADAQTTLYTEELTPTWQADPASQRYSFTHTPEYPLPDAGGTDESMQTATYLVTTTAASIADAFSPNNMLATNDFSYTVFSGLLYFNNVETEFSSISLGPSLECGTVFADNISLASLTGNWSDMAENYPVNAAGLCTEKQDNSDGFSVDLHLISGQAVLGTLAATVAGLHVEFAETTLDANGGAFSAAVVTLPETITAHGENGGLIDPFGTDQINFPGRSFQQSLEGVTISTFVSYLHSYGLPFYLKSSAIRLPININSSGISLFQPYPVYIHQEAVQALAPADPRTSFPANDIIFSNPIQSASNTVTFDRNGLDGLLWFQGDSGNGLQTSFPRARLGFDYLGLILEDSTIQQGTLNNVTFTMKFDRSCMGPECSGNTYDARWYRVNAARAGLHASGAFGIGFADIGPSMDMDLNDTGEDSTEWGVFPLQDDNGTPNQQPGTYIRQDRNRSGAFLVPGFIMPQTAETLAEPLRLSQVLLGSYLFNDQAGPATFLPLHDPANPAATRGDGFFAGLNLGPENYTSLDEGAGQLLNNQTLIRFFAADTVPAHISMIDRPAVKYVLRPGGLTGVFNTAFDSTVDGTVDIYGYTFNFSRFAFRQDRNRLNSYTFIDGTISLRDGPVANDIDGNQQDFNVAFLNLDLTCDGNLGSGQVDTGDEPTWPACDDQGEHKGCQTLMYWNMPVLLTGMAFEYSPDQNAGNQICPSADKVLQLHTRNQIDGLDNPLTLSGFYSSAGVLHDQEFYGDVQSRCDSPVDSTNGRGFDIRLRTAYLNQVPTDTNGNALLPQWNGFSVLAGLTDVPLFDDLRLAGHFDNLGAQDREDFDLYIFQDETANDLNRDGVPENPAYLGDTVTTLRNRLHTEGREPPKPYFSYSWPSGDMVNLNAYAVYQRTALDSGPRFSGLPKEADIFGVVQVQSVPDYITPKKTKLSFRLSADVAALQNFQLDIGNYTGTLDIFLHEVLHVDPAFSMSSVLCTSINGEETCLYDLEEKMLSLTGGDLTAVLAPEFDNLLLDAALEPMLTDTARNLTYIHQAPGMINGILVLPLRDIRADLHEIVSTELPGQFELLYNDLSSVALFGVPALLSLADNPGLDVLQNMEDQVRLFRNRLGMVIDHLDSGITTVQQAAEELVPQCPDPSAGCSGIIDRLDTAALQTLEELTLLENALTSHLTSSLRIPDPSLNPLFKQVEEARKVITDIRAAIGGVDLDTLGNELQDAALMFGAEIDTSLLSNIRRTVNSSLNELDLAISRADQVIAKTYTDILDGGNSRIDTMVHQGTRLIGEGSTVRENITILRTRLEVIKSRIINNYHGVEMQLTALREPLDELRRNIDPDGVPTLTGIDDTDDWASVRTRAQSFLDDSFAVAQSSMLGQSGIAFEATVPVPVDFLALFGGEQLSLLLNIPFQIFLTASGEGNLPGLLSALAEAADSALPQPTTADLRTMFRNALLDSEPVTLLNTTYYSQFGLISDQLDNITTQLTARINELIRQTVSVVDKQLSAQLAAAVHPVGQSSGWTGLQSVGIDGYALISQDEIERIHMGAEFVFDGGSDPTSYNAALDVFSLAANNGAAGCGGNSGNYYDVILSTHDVTARMLGGSVGIKSAAIGFTINQDARPVALFGNCYLNGAVSYEPLVLDDLGLEVGIGECELYFGATGSGHFDSYQIPRAAFYLGRSCPDSGQGVLQRLDPEAGRFIGDISPLTGIYARGSVDIPVWDNGCAFTIGLGADVGAWYFTEPDPMGTIGALVGGSAYGRLSCLAALKGKITCMGQLSGTSYSFSGSGWAGAGIGDCSPGSWQSVSDVRRDKWCETGDATFKASYDQEWNIEDLSINCCD